MCNGDRWDEGDERLVVQRRAQELGYAFADLDRIAIPETALGCLPRDRVVGLRVLPVKKEGNTVYLAVDRVSSATLHALADESGLRIIPIMVVSKALDEAITRHFGAKP